MTFREFTNSRAIKEEDLEKAFEIVSKIFENIPQRILNRIKVEGYETVVYEFDEDLGLVTEKFKNNILDLTLQSVFVDDMPIGIKSVEVNFEINMVTFNKMETMAVLIEKSNYTEMDSTILVGFSKLID